MQNSIRMARMLLEQRIVREDVLAPLCGLAEPCWLILLQLFSADYAEKRSVTSVATLLNVSVPTAERYLQLLSEKGFVRISLNGTNMSAVLHPSTLRAMEDVLRKMCQLSCAALKS